MRTRTHHGKVTPKWNKDDHKLEIVTGGGLGKQVMKTSWVGAALNKDVLRQAQRRSTKSQT